MDTLAQYKKVAVPIKDSESTIEQPHLPVLAAELKAEVAHSDPLKHTKVPEFTLVRCSKYKNAANVEDKIKHKFDLGLYGKFPEDTVMKFVRDYHDKKALSKGEWRDLILHTE